MSVSPWKLVTEQGRPSLGPAGGLVLLPACPGPVHPHIGGNVPGRPRQDCHGKAAFSLLLRDDGVVHEGPALRSLGGRPGRSGDGVAVHPALALGRPPRLMCRGPEP